MTVSDLSMTILRVPAAPQVPVAPQAPASLPEAELPQVLSAELYPASQAVSFPMPAAFRALSSVPAARIPRQAVLHSLQAVAATALLWAASPRELLQAPVTHLSSYLLSFYQACIDFSFIPAFDIFLVNGNMKGIISFVYFILIFAIVLVTTLLAVMFAVKKSVSVTPCQALAVTE